MRGAHIYKWVQQCTLRWTTSCTRSGRRHLLRGSAPTGVGDGPTGYVLQLFRGLRRALRDRPICEHSEHGSVRGVIPTAIGLTLELRVPKCDGGDEGLIFSV